MVIGITGGVGSGKSTVLKRLEQQYRLEICMADELGHEVMKRGMPAYQRILDAFGHNLIGENGELDRDALAALVYAEDEKLSRLNKIVHPIVLEEIRRRIEHQKPDSIFLLETALMFETECHTLCDEVWGVVTEDEIRIRRLMDARGYTREKAESIMAKQLSNEALKKRCHRIIQNNGDMEQLSQQLRTYMEMILEK